MKYTLQLIFISILLTTLCCKEEKSPPKTIETEKLAKQNISVEQAKDSVLKNKEMPKHYEHKYVTARSGLNYRNTPKGEVLGKFSLNTYLKIIEYTKIPDQINDNGKMITGEWVGVEKRMSNEEVDTVYVFSGFLSEKYVQSDIKLYDVSSFDEENGGSTTTAFVNISETYFENVNEGSDGKTENLILTAEDLTKDIIRLNKNQTNKFLKFSNVSESDKIFIYSIRNGNVKTLPIKDLPVIASINVYFHEGQYEKSELDYEFGFDLGKRSYGDLVYIGENNPFQSGQLTSIVWKRIDNQYFPKKINSDVVSEHKKSWLHGYEATESYSFSDRHLTYYIQNVKKNDRLHRYIIVMNSDTQKIVFEDFLIDSESTYLIPLRTSSSDENYGNQWTGKLFKNKATVMFGFLGHSFGCPSITVLDQREPSIPILCDNRH